MKRFTMLYRLFTENKNKDKVCKIVSEYFEGFTVFEAIGYWQGKQENSLCIEVIAGDCENIIITNICNVICRINEQDCVLVQKIDIEQYLT